MWATCGDDVRKYPKGGRREHARAMVMRVRAWVWGATRAWRGGGLADSMSAAICPSKDVEEEGDEKVRGEGPRPRPATKVMKAHAQLRFVTVRREGKRARLVSVRARVRDVIV